MLEARDVGIGTAGGRHAQQFRLHLRVARFDSGAGARGAQFSFKPTAIETDQHVTLLEPFAFAQRHAQDLFRHR
ncbi:hypothetical protein D3C73_886290 [compost metagenome]